MNNKRKMSCSNNSGQYSATTENLTTLGGHPELNDQFCTAIHDPTCAKILDSTTDPNNIRFKATTDYHNYSKYECDNRPDNKYRYLVLGQRNPVQCCVSQPVMSTSGKNDTIDYMSSCNDKKYQGYNRNGRWAGSLFDPKPFK